MDSTQLHAHRNLIPKTMESRSKVRNKPNLQKSKLAAEVRCSLLGSSMFENRGTCASPVLIDWRARNILPLRIYSISPVLDLEQLYFKALLPSWEIYIIYFFHFLTCWIKLCRLNYYLFGNLCLNSGARDD